MKRDPIPAHGRVALLGFGRSNRALLPAVLARADALTIRDRHPLPAGTSLPADRRVRILCGEQYLEGLEQEDVLFRSPGLRPDLPALHTALACGARLLSEWEYFSALSPAPVLGVTGSDGKTTTATLCAALLRQEFGEEGRQVYLGGNIGVPLTPLLPIIRPGDVAVAELSSFQLMTPGVPPARAAILNLHENHLDWHTSMAEYGAAKENILGKNTVAVLNAEDPFTSSLATRRRGETWAFSDRRSCMALARSFPYAHCLSCAGGTIALDGLPLCPSDCLRVPGRHVVQDLMAALALAYPYLSEPAAAVQAVAARFTGVPHRLEWVGEVDGVRYYNSSIDSTPSRTQATVQALGGRPILLLGGAGKNLSFHPLNAVLPQIRAAILFGAAREEIAAALTPGICPLYQAPRMEEAVAQARKIAQAGDSILLSPACTSFDEFHHYEERGARFRALVQEYKKESEGS